MYKLFIYGQWQTARSVIFSRLRCILKSATRFSGRGNDLSNHVSWLGFQRHLICVDLPTEMVSPGELWDHPSYQQEQFIRLHSDAANRHRWVTAACGYTWYQFRGFDWGIMRWLWVMMCVHETVEQTVLCINKERWISCGEIYECHISCVGDIIIQARVKTGEDEAFQATVVLPLRKWIRLDCYIQDSKVKHHSVCHWEVGWGIEINTQLGATSYSPPSLLSFLWCPYFAVFDFLLEQL